MSVVPMALVTLAGPVEWLDDVARICILEQEFQPENAMRLMGGVANIRPILFSNPYTALIHQSETLAEQLGVSLDYQEVARSRFTDEMVVSYLSDLENRFSALRDRRDALSREAELTRAAAHQLENLHGLPAPLEELRALQYLTFQYGHLPQETYNSFRDAIDARPDVFFFPVKVDAERVHAIYFTTRAAKDAAEQFFQSLRFTAVPLDDDAFGTADAAIDTLTQQAQDTDHRAENIAGQMAQLALQEGARLRAIWSWLRVNNAVRDIRRFAVQAGETFYFMGWTPRSNVDALSKRVCRFDKVSMVFDRAEDVKEVTPPTKLKNSFFARAFEPFLRMYGLPAYHELDPSVFMAITYSLFFGIMFGDVGQGLCLAAIGLVLALWKHMWLGQIITCCGLSGAIFGCFYGSVFGFEDVLPGFKILEPSTWFPGASNVMVLLIGSLALGVVMLVFVMILNMINGIKQRNVEKILFGPNGLCGLLFYLGIIVAAVSSLVLQVNLFIPAYVIPVLVLPIFCILCKEPLSKLLSHDPTWKRIKPGELLGVGFFELFETMLSYLTNTLSFLRIGAYAITHVGLMMVVRMLAGSGLNPVVIILGNVFVMGFEGLLVGIQVLRLDFYELFGRFYSDGGLEFKPLDIHAPVK